MQIYTVLRRKCHAHEEIEYFLFIQEITQAIELTKLYLDRHMYRVDDLPKVVELLEFADSEKYAAVNRLTKFGLPEKSAKYHSSKGTEYTSEFYKWYQWWSDYLYTLNDIELDELEKSRINGEDLSEWYPENSWKT